MCVCLQRKQINLVTVRYQIRSFSYTTSYLWRHEILNGRQASLRLEKGKREGKKETKQNISLKKLLTDQLLPPSDKRTDSG